MPRACETKEERRALAAADQRRWYAKHKEDVKIRKRKVYQLKKMFREQIQYTEIFV